MQTQTATYVARPEWPKMSTPRTNEKGLAHDVLADGRYQGDKSRPRSDVPRLEPRLKVRVQNRSTGNLSLPDGWMVSAGVSEIEIYKSSWPLIEALVEDEIETIAAAEKSFTRKLAIDIADRRIKGESSLSDLNALPRDELIKRIESLEDPRIAAIATEWLATTGHSPQSEFMRMTGRCVKPLVSAEIIEELPPPEQHASIERAKHAAEASGPVVAVLAQVLEKISEQNNAILSLLSEKNGKGKS